MGCAFYTIFRLVREQHSTQCWDSQVPAVGCQHLALVWFVCFCCNWGARVLQYHQSKPIACLVSVQVHAWCFILHGLPPQPPVEELPALKPAMFHLLTPPHKLFIILFIIHKFAISRLWWSCTPVLHSPFRLFLYKKNYGHTCMCLHMCISHVHICVYTCMCHMCMCVGVCTCVNACGSLCVCEHVHMRVGAWLQACVCVCSGFISDVVVKFPDKKQLKGEGFLSFLHMWDL